MSSSAFGRRQRARGLVLFAVGALAPVLPCWVQQPVLAADLVDDPVLVTATRSPRGVSATLADITIIEREQIVAAQHLPLTELLARQPGVEVLDQGGPGSVSSIFLRGTNAQQVLVLVDGVRVGSATTSTTAVEHIPLAQIERIEIVRGPASALYGSDAIGGVIQIFTRSRGERSVVEASAGVGGFGQSQLAAGLSHADARWQLGVQVSRDESSGFSAIRRRGTAPVGQFDSFVPDRDGYHNESANGRLAYRWGSAGEMALFGGHTSSRREFDAGSFFPGIESDQRLQRAGVSGRTDGAGPMTWRWLAARAVDDLDGGFGSRLKTTQDQAQLQADLRLADFGSATIGVEHLRQQVDGNVAFTVRTRNVSSLFGAWQWDTGRHRLQASARHDSNSQFGAFNSGSLAYGFDLTPTLRWVASGGSAFRMPSFNDLYNPGPFAAGRPDLRPERALNLETGLRWRVASWEASVNVFRNRIRDLIQLAPDFSPGNLSEAVIRGVSLQAAGTLAGVRLAASIDLQDPEDANTGDRLRYRARSIGRLAATWSRGPSTLNAVLRAQGDRFDDAANTRSIPGYATLDLGYEHILGAGWSAALRLQDVFDREPFTGFVFGNRNEVFAMPGRSAFVQLRYRIH